MEGSSEGVVRVAVGGQEDVSEHGDQLAVRPATKGPLRKAVTDLSPDTPTWRWESARSIGTTLVTSLCPQALLPTQQPTQMGGRLREGGSGWGRGSGALWGGSWVGIRGDPGPGSGMGRLALRKRTGKAARMHARVHTAPEGRTHTRPCSLRSHNPGAHWLPGQVRTRVWGWWAHTAR